MLHGEGISVGRDPFSRGEYWRRCYADGRCGWCGERKARVYSYTWEPDDSPNRYPTESDTFCNLDCFRSYGGN